MLAQEAARTHKHDLIGSAHLLLGLLDEPRGLAHEVPLAKAPSEQAVRDAIEDALPPPGKDKRWGHIRVQTGQHEGDRLRASRLV